MRNMQISEEERERRMQLKLPLTKALRYLSRDGQAYTSHRVMAYEIVGRYTSGSCSLLLSLESGKKVRIHSAFFAQMQQPSFVRDIEEQAQAL